MHKAEDLRTHALTLMTAVCPATGKKRQPWAIQTLMHLSSQLAKALATQHHPLRQKVGSKWSQPTVIIKMQADFRMTVYHRVVSVSCDLPTLTANMTGRPSVQHAVIDASCTLYLSLRVHRSIGMCRRQDGLAL